MKNRLLFCLLLMMSLVTKATDCLPMAWRGLMLDVSRHYMPLADIKRQVDAMSHFRLNVLHLHLTDAAGWRMEIKKYPRLTEVGAWRTAPDWETWWNGDRQYGGVYGGYYTQDELRHLADYAQERGVVVVPEIEFPAHSEELIAAYPFLGYNHAEVDMQKDSVYDFYRDVLTEVVSVFPSEYIHLGGDESATQQDVRSSAMRRMNDIVHSLGRQMVVWDEALTDDPSDSTMVVMVWRNADIATRSLERHHPTILCMGKWCYFDKPQDAPPTQPRSAGGYLPFDSVLALPIDDFSDSKYLLGVQGNLWTEYIPNTIHAEYMLWPRGIAISMIGNRESYDASSVAEGVQWLRDSLGVNAFDPKKEVGERKEKSDTLNCLSVGAEVRYLAPYHAWYSASGVTTLTDGLRGGWSNTDGRWQGFIGRTGMDVVIDLKQEHEVQGIRADFFQSMGPEIYLPYTFTIEVSRDGEHYHTVYQRDEVSSPFCEDVQTLGWLGAERARYIHVQAKPGPRQGWVFCDEVVVW